MCLALFFSGCNHYKSIHFAGAKIQLIFHSARKSFAPYQEKAVPAVLAGTAFFFAAGYATHILVVITDKAHRDPVVALSGIQIAVCIVEKQ